MPTGARRRRPFDVERLARAVSRPGIDPRTSVSAARIDGQADAVRWENEYGWVVDVRFYGSGLDQEESSARILSAGPAGDGFGEFLPPGLGSEVLVGVPDGEPETGAVVLGTLTNRSGDKPPSQVNGFEISGEVAASIPLTGPVSPYDTEIKVSPHSRREQYAGDLVSQARSVALVSDVIRLGSESAEQSALLGDATNDNLSTLIGGLKAMAATFAAMTGPLAPFQAVGTTLTTTLELVEKALPATLAKAVKLE
jgi:hypothetical protein